MNHKVSATATNEFWKIAKEFWPKLMEAKEEEQITKKKPLFQNQRKKLNNAYCPEIHMEFGYLNVNTGIVHKVQSHTTPIKDYQQNPDYVKL